MTDTCKIDKSRLTSEKLRSYDDFNSSKSYFNGYKLDAYNGM